MNISVNGASATPPYEQVREQILNMARQRRASEVSGLALRFGQFPGDHAVGAGLDEDVAQGGGVDRPGKHWESRRDSGELAQELVVGSTAAEGARCRQVERSSRCEAGDISSAYVRIRGVGTSTRASWYYVVF
jgi:hypothetical protein